MPLRTIRKRQLQRHMIKKGRKILKIVVTGQIRFGVIGLICPHYFDNSTAPQCEQVL